MEKLKKFNEDFISSKDTYDFRGKKYTDICFDINDNPNILLINTRNIDINGKLCYMESDTYSTKAHSYKLKELYIKSGHRKYYMGYVVISEDNPIAIIGIYEPHGMSYNKNFRMITVFGHEEIVNVKLPSFEYDVIHTR